MISGGIFYSTLHDLNVEPDPTNSTLLYVFEIVRHGARAPIWGNADTAAKFPVQPGQLTPQGMRQRYLLGRYNYQKFGKYLKSDRRHLVVEVKSTDVLRTI